MAQSVQTPPIPNPISDEAAAELQLMADSIQRVLSVVTECEGCEVDMSATRASLERSLRRVQGLLAIYHKHKV